MSRNRLTLVRRMRSDSSGLALIEFAFAAPILLALSLTGAELTHYITTKMRMSQLALHLADNAARIGSGSQLSAKRINEADINDLFIGAGLQGGELDLYEHGRVIISSLEPMANPNEDGTFRIRWQRCRGAKTDHESTYGDAGDTDLDGMGIAGRQAIAPENGVTMFVEVYYEYQPLLGEHLAPSTSMVEIGSMMVRDRRDTAGGNNGVYPVSGVTPSSC
ncbi:MAG: pilus assembly protein [Alphaproteobacteria bacterium]|jgi:hypothetical protein|nr:pilus assembly protein [Alphaproteobacteria bacterium]MBU2340332.1 pilus assembly protein [Alphaproteobacteria bacterium]